ncbi:hypothetical protein ACRYCC_12130 [Actinomadura scrupuli]|uniref:hypothetical protein n=1 Tax=Actinomadura scrupuli TaxID=559629 RepID=UPI003D967B72
MTQSATLASPLSEGALPARPVRTYFPWILLAGWAAQVCVRLAFAAGHGAPIVNPDEAGYLIGARWLTGGPGTDLSGFTFYQGGYSLLLAPAYLVSSDPGVVYRLAIGINSLAGALIFPLGYLLLRRLGLSRLHGYTLGWAAALLPATTLFGVVAMADAVFPVLVLGWLLALDRFVRRGGTGAVVTASLVACFAHATHTRGTVIVALHCSVLVAYLVRGRARRGPLVGLGVTAAGFVAATFLNDRLSHALYPYGTRDLGSNVLDRATSLSGQAWALSGGVGQLWAMIATTWGIGGLGLVVTARVMCRPHAPREDRIMAGALLAATASVAYLTSAALPDEHRVANFAYARYLSCFALVYTLIGLAALVRHRSPTREIAATFLVFCGAGLWVLGYAGPRLRTHLYLGWDFPEIGLLGGGGYDRLRLLVTSVVVCVLLLTFVLLRRWGVVKLFSALLVLNLCALTFIVVALTQQTPPPPQPGVPAGRAALERPIPGVEHPPMDPVYPVPELIYARVAYLVHWTRLERFDPGRGVRDPSLCAAIVFWPKGLRAADTWPEHPPGWRFRPGGTPQKRSRWVTWYNPSCPAAR